jgi:hypothetical protein
VVAAHNSQNDGFRKGVRFVLSKNLIEKIENPIFFRPLTGDSADGYEAEACGGLRRRH